MQSISRSKVNMFLQGINFEESNRIIFNSENEVSNKEYQDLLMLKDMKILRTGIFLLK